MGAALPDDDCGPGSPLQQGRALLRLGRAAPAAAAFRRALALRPGDAVALSGLASALIALGDLPQALACSAEAFRLLPNHDMAVDRSRVLLAANDHAEALAAATHALALDAGSVLARRNQALALDGLGRYEDAVQAWRIALAGAPGDTDICHSLAALLLKCGQLTREAWALHERRLDWSTLPRTVQRWTGGEVGGRTVLLYAEQGFGDTLQFVRYAPLLAARGAKVVLALQPALARLLSGTPGVAEVCAIGGALPRFDLFCPLLSLPALFGTTLDTIPPPLPYRIVQRPPGPGPLRVGLAWSGNPGFVHDRDRSIPADALSALAGAKGIQFHSLHYGGGALPSGLAIAPLAEVADFADTAGHVAGLDLVVSVDTAVAHLAATMLKPVWLLSRHRGCWRWLNERSDSPWYPSMRILRQERPNDWTDVLAQVRRDLAVVAAGSAGCADREVGVDAFDHTGPVTGAGLPVDAHRGIPGTVVPVP